MSSGHPSTHASLFECSSSSPKARLSSMCASGVVPDAAEDEHAGLDEELPQGLDGAVVERAGEVQPVDLEPDAGRERRGRECLGHGGPIVARPLAASG